MSGLYFFEHLGYHGTLYASTKVFFWREFSFFAIGTKIKKGLHFDSEMRYSETSGLVHIIRGRCCMPCLFNLRL